MKRGYASLAAVILASLLAGCGIIPKPVEIGQKKVKAVPEQTARGAEAERQAAAYVSARVDAAQTGMAAEYGTNAPPAVAAPLADAAPVARALTTSLGPPLSPWDDTGDALAARLLSEVARLNQRMDRYTADTRGMAGKKIEGTGWLQIPWILYAPAMVLGFILLLTIGRMALRAAALANPTVGLGLSAVKLPAAALKQGFAQLIAAGERFKEEVETRFEPAVAEKVKELFRTSHQTQQDAQIQSAVKTITS